VPNRECQLDPCRAGADNGEVESTALAQDPIHQRRPDGDEVFDGPEGKGMYRASGEPVQRRHRPSVDRQQVEAHERAIGAAP